MNTPNALPVRIRKHFEENEYPINLQTHANFRYTLSMDSNPDSSSTNQEQLNEFEQKVINIIGEMPESFMVMNKSYDAGKLYVKVRAVGYSASNEVALTGYNNKGDKVEQFIHATVKQVRAFFGDEPANKIEAILVEQNEQRKQQEVIKTLAPVFGDAVSSRMAQLLKQVLEEEAAKGIAPEDSAVIPGVASGLLPEYDSKNIDKPSNALTNDDASTDASSTSTGDNNAGDIQEEELVTTTKPKRKR